jgi:predicted ABC-type ATPase
MSDVLCTTLAMLDRRLDHLHPSLHSTHSVSHLGLVEADDTHFLGAALSEDMITGYVKAVMPHVKPSGTPIGILMVGGPGSGKTGAQTMCLALLNADPSSFVIVNPDRVLSGLFDNDNSHYPDTGDVLKALIDKAIDEKRNIIFDFTGRDFMRSRTWAERMKASGYRVVACMVQLAPETAIDRANKRAQIEGRSVDVDYLQSTYVSIATLIPKYVELPLLDDVYLFDNSGSSLTSVLSFNRKNAAAVSPILAGVNTPIPSIWCQVVYYNANGPVDEVSVPVTYTSGETKFLFNYGWIGLPDWSLEIDKSNRTLISRKPSKTWVYKYVLHHFKSYSRLLIMVSPDQLVSIPSLPQKDSVFWKAQAASGEKSLNLVYTVQSGSSDISSLVDALGGYEGLKPLPFAP